MLSTERVNSKLTCIVVYKENLYTYRLMTTNVKNSIKAKILVQH